MVLEREIDLDCSAYDALIFSLTIPADTTFVAKAYTDKGIKVLKVTSKENNSTEFDLDLEGASRIKKITMTLDSPGAARGWFRWIGLKNKKKLADWLNYWEKFAKIRWDKHLETEEDYSFAPAYGLLMNSTELTKLRKFHAEYYKNTGSSPFVKMAEELQAGNFVPPESMIGEMASHGKRYTRHRNYLLWKKIGSSSSKARQFAFAGILLKDKKMLQLAARYALSLAACNKWGTGMQGHMPGTSFDHRSFDETSIVMSIALVLDLAGEALSEAGRTFLLRAIAERGIGNINYVTWRYDYIFKSNQLAAFSQGRILGYLVMEENWKHVKPYTDLALKELDSSIVKIFQMDGGFGEGPAYFQYTMGTALAPYYSYAKVRNLKFNQVLPAPIARSGKYAEVFISTDQDQYFIPINDCNGRHGIWTTPIAFLSTMLPESQYVRLFHRYLDKKQLTTKNEWVWLFAAQIPKEIPSYKSFAEIKSINTAASTRFVGKKPVKLLVVGDSSLPGHRHHDAGSFVLEYAGQTFAMDSGSASYSDPRAHVMQSSQQHNSLLPMGISASAVTYRWKNSKLQASGDTVKFHAEMDISAAWQKYFVNRKRIWDSPAPDRLTISDFYELKQGNGVEFNWLTMLPVEQKADKIIITGNKGQLIIDIPADCQARIEKIPYLDDKKQTRIVFAQKGKKGIIKIKVLLK